ncbi:MAG: hypothetical protein ABI832_23630 [bacterium]
MKIETWADRPWQAVTDAELAPALQVPSMLSREESRLYHWLGASADGSGAVIDLGAFAGGSAARLLSGLRRSTSQARLYAYDRFTAGPKERAKFLYPAGMAETDDTDILPQVEAFLRPWQDRVTLVRGDIATLAWDKSPVEILAMDAGKSPALTDHVAAQFFRHMIPGKSVLIHQDFLHKTQPWLAAQMLALPDYFSAVAYVPRDCVVFECRKTVTLNALAAARTTDMTDDQLVAALEAAAQHFAPLLPAQLIRDMIPKLRANPGVRTAWKMRN